MTSTVGFEAFAPIPTTAPFDRDNNGMNFAAIRYTYFGD